MATSSALTTVQKLYIAYYGRAADAAGQVFWADKLDAAGGSLVGIIDAFATSAEALALYGTGTTATQRITTLYQNILGRNPDTPGLNYYVDQVNRGKLTLGNAALAILDGVRNTDVPLVTNRMAVANAFTSQVSTAAQSYEGDVAAAMARSFLKMVTGDTATLTSATDQLDAYLNTIAVASKQPAKFAGFVTNGLLNNTAIVKASLTEANLDETLKALTPTTAPTVGKLIDGGYLQGATVFADADGDGTLDPGETFTTSDALGNFTLPAGTVGNLVATGGTNLTTKLPFTGALQALAGASTMTPLTSLVHHLVEGGMDLAAAQAKVAETLGLPKGLDFLAYDPLQVLTSTTATALDKENALAVQKVATQLALAKAQTAAAIAGALDGASADTQGDTLARSSAMAVPQASPQALPFDPVLRFVLSHQSAARSIAESLAQTPTGQIWNFGQTPLLQGFVQGAFLGMGGGTQLDRSLGELLNLMSATMQLLANVATNNPDTLVPLVRLLQIKMAVLGGMVPAIQQGVQTGDLQPVFNNYTGNAFEQRLNDTTPGPIGANTPPPAPAPAPAPAPTPAPQPDPAPIPSDTTAPTATLSSSKTSLKAGETATLTITFSEAVKGFTKDDLTVESGTLGTLSSATTHPNGTVSYTIGYTPAVNTEDAAMAVTLANTYTDLANNAGTTAAVNIAVDTRPATATLSSVTANGFTLNANEAITANFGNASAAAPLAVAVAEQASSAFAMALTATDTAGNVSEVTSNGAPVFLRVGTSNTNGDPSNDTQANLLYGFGGGDSLSGGAQADTLFGGEGNDTLIGYADTDRLDGGAGADVFNIHTAADHTGAETISGGDGHDKIRFLSTAGATLVLGANVDVEEARISNTVDFGGGTTAEGIDATSAQGTIALYGNNGNNRLTGNSQANVIQGNGGGGHPHRGRRRRHPRAGGARRRR